MDRSAAVNVSLQWPEIVEAFGDTGYMVTVPGQAAVDRQDQLDAGRVTPLGVLDLAVGHDECSIGHHARMGNVHVMIDDDDRIAPSGAAIRAEDGMDAP